MATIIAEFFQVAGVDAVPPTNMAAPSPSSGSWKQKPTPPVVPPEPTPLRQRTCKAFWKGAGSCS